jgi:HlyD family secretion protein
MRLASLPCVLFASLLATSPASAASLPNSAVAYGRVVPGEQIMSITLPYFQAAPQLVAKLAINEGDRVTAGQALALSSNNEIAAASLAQAEAHEKTLEARLTLVTEGAKPEDVAAQAALVASQEYDLSKAREHLHRSAALHDNHIVSEATWLDDSADVGSLENKLAMSKHTLESMRHPRPTDILVAESDLAEAKAAVAQARALLALTELRAPCDGQVLKITAFPGEQPGDRGVLLFGDTSHMQIKAELDIGDIARVHVGALAEATSPAWAGEITGKVIRIAPHVDHSVMIPHSAFAPVDRRIVEVTVALDHPETVATLSGAEATVTIAAAP